MLYVTHNLNDHYVSYQLIEEWLKKKELEKKRFTDRETAERYVSKWGLLEKMCAYLRHNDHTARYRAAKEYLKETE